MTSPDLNEQANAQARKESGKHAHPIYCFAHLVVIVPALKTKTENVFIEAERWVDARTFVRQYFCDPEATVYATIGSDRFPRWQLRWRGTNGFVEMEARRVMEERDANEQGKRVPWRRLRDL